MLSPSKDTDTLGGATSYDSTANEDGDEADFGTALDQSMDSDSESTLRALGAAGRLPAFSLGSSSTTADGASDVGRGRRLWLLGRSSSTKAPGTASTSPYAPPSGASSLPDPSSVGESGSILARTSLRSIVTKRWRRHHWVRYGLCTLLVFRSENDFQDWLLNPYHGQKQRDYLSKLRLAFKEDMTTLRGVRGYRLTPTKEKSYGRGAPAVHHFKVERWTDLGMTIAVAFASENVAEVDTVREVIEACLRKCPHGGCRPIDDLLVKNS